MREPPDHRSSGEAPEAQDDGGPYPTHRARLMSRQGGLSVFWLTGVNAAESVALLESLMPATDFREDRRLADNALSAIALHKDPAADAALDRNVVASKPEQVRRQAAFWLGNAWWTPASRSAIPARA